VRIALKQSVRSVAADPLAHRIASALASVSFFAALLFGASGAHAESVSFKLPVSMSDTGEKPRVLRATKGDRIAIEWSSDKPTVVHIHPYDIEQELKPGASARSEFSANISGRFPIEAHPVGGKSRKIVGYLEVLPR
jgi:hypothetical protein